MRQLILTASIAAALGIASGCDRSPAPQQASATPAAQPAAAAEQVVDEHSSAEPDKVRTTDLAHIDEDGFLFVVGRADGAINRGGFKVMPETIVEALCQHPAVADAAALGKVPVEAVC